MHPDEVLAIGRLKQWAYDRTALKSARTTEYERTGWKTRNNRHADARIVRVMDFERALATLPAQEQLALILTYRDKQRQDSTAAAMDCSVRKLSYLLPQARQHLVSILDRMELL